VVIQTFSPENYIIQATMKHDYKSFYEKEISYRRQFQNPPFMQLARLIFTHANDAICQRETAKTLKVLLQEISTRGLGGISIIGPAPAFIHRLRGRFRWQMIIRGQGLSGFLAPVSLGRGWTIDIDPVSTIQ
jgi:primosomal protein N' (replication factor Y)